MHRIRSHLTFPNVVSVIALFVALSGSAVALEGRNNVDHNDLRKHVVHRGKIHDGAVNSAKIADGQVQTADLGTGAVTSPKIAGDAVTATQVKDGSLTVRDLGSFTGGFGWGGGSLAAHSCKTGQSVGTLDGDELVLASPVTPIKAGWTGSGSLIISPTWEGSSVALRVCNLSATTVDPVPLQSVRVLVIEP